MAFSRRITDKKRAYIYFMRTKTNLSLREISRICNVSPSYVLRICREGINAKSEVESKAGKVKTGRPCIFTERDRARFIRTF